jgi:hypothetical protein
MQGLKSTNAMIDALPPTAKRFAVALIAAALTAIGAALGINIECDAEAATSCLATLDKEAVKALVGAIVAYAVHALKNIKK